MYIHVHLFVYKPFDVCIAQLLVGANIVIRFQSKDNSI